MKMCVWCKTLTAIYIDNQWLKDLKHTVVQLVQVQPN